MSVHLCNPFLDLASPQGGRQTAAAPVSSPVSAAAVTNSAPEVMALTAPGMARRLESQAKATEDKAGMAGVSIGPVRRPTAGTGLRVGEAGADQPATDEFMAVTAGRDRQPIPIPEPAEGFDPDQNATGGVLIPVMVAGQLGESEAGEATTASARAASSSALRAPADPDAVEGGCGHAPALSTAARVFGPGDILTKFETDLASIVADINAHERFMRGLPAFIAAPSAAYLTAISRNP